MLHPPTSSCLLSIYCYFKLQKIFPLFLLFTQGARYQLPLGLFHKLILSASMTTTIHFAYHNQDQQTPQAVWSCQNSHATLDWNDHCLQKESKKTISSTLCLANSRKMPPTQVIHIILHGYKMYKAEVSGNWAYSAVRRN